MNQPPFPPKKKTVIYYYSVKEKDKYTSRSSESSLLPVNKLIIIALDEIQH